MTERNKRLNHQNAKAVLDAMANLKKSGPYEVQDQWNDAAVHVCRMVEQLCPDYRQHKDLVTGLAISGGLTGYDVQDLPKSLRRDEQVVATILNCKVQVLESDRKDFLAPFVDNMGLMLAALDDGVASYADVSPRLRTDADIALACIDRNDPAKSLSQFPPELFKDLYFVISAMEIVGPTVVEPFISDVVRQDSSVQDFLEAAKAAER